MTQSCLSCRNYYPRLESWAGKQCHSFPNGIPWDILDGETLHNEPIEEQENDLVFVLIEDWPSEDE